MTSSASPAELTLIQTRANQLNALIALYQAMGGGWSASAIATSAPD
jgi:multidrug efflux system outer membrane protein